MTTLERIQSIGIIPVIRAESAEQAMKAVDAIREGGIDILEITMTVPGAVKVIEQLASRHGKDVLVGAGTVLDAETARSCMLAGAEFFVSPAVNLEVIALCKRYGKVVAPGALTPSEVLSAFQAGAEVIKIFPCDSVGGAKYIKSLKAPFPQINFIPTGGVNLDNAGDFIRAGSLAVGVGANLVDLKLIREGKSSVITDRARNYLTAIKEARSPSR